MKTVLIVGAGAQGGPCASILARDADVETIILGDVNPALLKRVEAKINSPKITVMALNAGDPEAMRNAARGVDVIINLVLPVFNENIMRTALETGVHYVDTSFGEPEMMDLCARDNILGQIMQGRPLMLDEDFKKAGLTALVGCGGTPGLINVFVRYLSDKLTTVDSIRMKFGEGPRPSPDQVPGAWNPGWSPFRALWGFAVEPAVFTDGRYAIRPIFDAPEVHTFPEPIGSILISRHQHQEQITLPYFIGKGIRECEYKYPVDPQAATFVRMGFGNPDPITVKGTAVSPRDVLLQLTPAPGNAFLEEDAGAAAAPVVQNQIWTAEVSGTKDGQPLRYAVTAPYTFYWNRAEKQRIYNTFGATDIGVALPAVIGAKMCVAGEADPGVIAAECLDPGIFLQRIASSGAPLTFHETCTRAAGTVDD